MKNRKINVSKTKESNQINKPVFLLLFLLCYGINLFSQYSIKNEENVLTKKELKSLQRAIDYQLEFYNKAFPDSVMKRSAAKITVFKKYNDYMRYYQEKDKYARPNTFGYYDSQNKEVIICKEKCEWYFLGACYHELSHFFIRSYMNPPVWLNEGLATCFGNIEVSKSIKHKRNFYYRARVKTMLELNDINLKEFIDWNQQKFYDMSFSHNDYGYALAHCIVAFLMQDEATMVAVINHIYEGESCYDALDIAYKGGFAAFEKDFIRSMGKLKSPKINPDFIYSLPVKPGDTIRSDFQKNNNGFTLVFDLSSAGDTIYACRGGRIDYVYTDPKNMVNNRIIIKHEDGSFSEYLQFEKLLVNPANNQPLLRQYNYVKRGEPIAIHTGKRLPKVIGFAVYYLDENKTSLSLRYRSSHIIPVFHTHNAEDVKLERNTDYTGGVNEQVLIQEMSDKRRKIYEGNKSKLQNR